MKRTRAVSRARHRLRATLSALPALYAFASIPTAGLFAQAAGPTVKAWITTTTANGVARGLEPIDSTAFNAVSQDSAIAIKIDETIRYQKWEGAGASFTDGAAWLVHQVVKPELRDSLMTMLFDPDKGIGVSYLRNPMGSSDLTLERYTYDDSAADKNDSTLPHFSIDHDRQDVLPMTKLARKLNPDLTLMMNAWSPPGWMKSNGSVVDGGILPRYYSHHAYYYVNTIKAYEAEGVHINYVTLNNEPTCCDSIDYPSVRIMGTDAMKTMLKSYWLPLFAREKVTTKILLLDFNYSFFDLVQPFLTDGQIKNSPSIGGIAFHGYDGDPSVQTAIFDQYEYDIFFTEWSGWADGRDQQERDMRMMVSVIRNFGKSFVKWPVASDEQNGPHIGGCGGCKGLVRVWRFDQAKTGQFDYRIDYYDIGHITKFVRNGAYRIYSTGSMQLLNVAFQNPDGSIALLVFNDTPADQTLKVLWSGQSFTYTVPSKASITFKWTPAIAVLQNYMPPSLLGLNVSLRQAHGYISVGLPSVNSYTIELFDVRGRSLARNSATGGNSFIDTRGLGSGMYFFRVLANGMSVVKSCVLDGGR